MSDIITEFRNENTKDIDILPTLEMVKKMNDEDKLVALAVEDASEEIAQAIDLIAKQFLKGGRLLYFGAGTSGRLGILDASECPPTFSVDPSMVQGIIAGGDSAIRKSVEGAEDDFELGREDAKVLTDKDVAVVISASGNPKYLLGVLNYAEEIGAKTIGVTCNSKGKIAEEAGLVICAEVGPEVIAGSSRLKAGTAQKMILNMLTTGSMIKIGKTYENFMIDLQAVNEKLKDRAIRIVAQIANVQHSDALATLLKCNWEIKTAIISLTMGLDIDESRAELRKHGGVLRKLMNSRLSV
ncbi:TPA: N-acetylmuramic acid 6-phosphate etherase [Candidatus Scatousia excrementigallinarum]|uniref:N-acetylmuramic acid 6-phosphate etherase n=1 Tax=Candidatus Scatousia excrementigallinarum TaxID=2840935 RepID=A0A9D1JP46_9BACT|nr:N-acetylmuramic acid 6-phosphate etherase [Candidatus Scatousia excrementigallinarum]